ncbi:MAG: vWA domain-containing protein [Dehalococcoidia bacterium]
MNRLDESVEFAQNPDPRCPCVLLIDTSRSMTGERIDAMNEGLRAFQMDLQQDPLAQRRVEVAIVSFGGEVQVVQDFITAGQFIAPTLTATGNTPMGGAILRSLDMVRDRKAQYRANGVSYYRPWIFLITDGEPTDNWKEAAQRVRDEEAANALAFFSVGVAGADIQTLEQISTRQPVQLRGLEFGQMFLWLSQSQKRVSASKVGEQTALPPAGWAAV